MNKLFSWRVESKACSYMDWALPASSSFALEEEIPPSVFQFSLWSAEGTTLHTSQFQLGNVILLEVFNFPKVLFSFYIMIPNFSEKFFGGL